MCIKKIKKMLKKLRNNISKIKIKYGTMPNALSCISYTYE